ncbi:MAG TPA: energy transducer TonB, partial [Chitinophagaceae bacterium]|nr:energy transducer TonB [Chitinophagaceae bacterium]
QYLEKSLNTTVPVDNGAPAGKYTVILQFIVDKQGQPYDIRSLTNHGYGMEEEVMRVIKKGPNWTPAIQNGRPVKAYKKQPVTFLVANDFDISLTELIAGKETEITIDYKLKEGQSLEPSIYGGTIRHKEGKKFMIKVDKPGNATLVVHVSGNNQRSYVGSFMLEIKQPE